MALCWDDQWFIGAYQCIHDWVNLWKLQCVIYVYIEEALSLVNEMLASLFALASSELGVNSAIINIILSFAILLVIGLPLFFILRSQGGSLTSRKVSLREVWT